MLPGTPEATTRKDVGDVSVGLWWTGTSALSIIVNRMIMRLFDGVGCAPRRAFSLFGHRRRLLFSNYSACIVYTPTVSRYSPCAPLHVGIYERTPETTNYNASASDASGVSNEMQEVWARVVHQRGARLRESVMKVEWNSEMQRKKERKREREREREERKKKRECARERIAV